ncbi:PucR family transcriptional regulator [Streptomyces sp. H27-G5]|uniref:PucR family transcriptional regulator n=1 Tax=Streptomyces sp. H27-G5 TaxID=2996698 RepID=UPI00226FC337|nr:PucR family transcriptional regulator [Streptomyces sp. H27-G5]MCY0916721.1 PucR family transcriptional regulator [Streptomyces sp. H27-G5]
MPRPAQEQQPPTPGVELGALLADRELGLRTLAPGGGGATAPATLSAPATPAASVHAVHASEMPDPSPYLLGGELLLTAGAWLGRDDGPGAGAGADRGAATALRYVERLVRAGVAALGFGVTPVHGTVPRELTDACVALGLPLVEVPPGTPFTAVARTVWRLMAQARTAEVRRVAEAQQSLAAAAARPDPVPAVLARLATALSGHAALVTPGAPDRSAGRPVPERAREALAALARHVGAPGPATATDQAAGWHLSVYALGRRPTGASTDPTGTGIGAGTGPGAGTGTGTGTGTTGTGTGTGAGTGTGTGAPPAPADAGSPAPQGAPQTAPQATPTASAPPGPVLALATPLRAPGDQTIASIAAVLLTLLTADRPGGSGEAAALTRLLLGATPAQTLGPGPWTAVHARGGGDPAALAAALGTPLYAAEGTLVRLLTPREPGPRPGWRLGVSSPAPADPAALAAADAQAARALQRAESARAPLARHADTGVAGLVGEPEARAHAEAVLAPLSPVLRETLRGWLAHHGSWDRTAAALGVHRNTVRQRIARCAALLERDPDDADVRMELWFALRWAAAPTAQSPPPAPRD